MSDNSNLITLKLKMPILVGPTGVGKSEIAFLLAKRLKAEIISADAFQVYRGLEVGTAQPLKEWQKEIPHHLIGTRDPGENWNAVEFAREAKKIIDHHLNLGKSLILVGGAGFYIRALVEGPPGGNSPRPELRSFVQEKVKELGNEKALAWLREKDSAAGERLHVNDIQRICRALEKTFETDVTKMDYIPIGAENVLFFGFEKSRDKLDELLRIRSESMWRRGLLNEAKKLMESGLPSDHPIWGTIGYSEAVLFLKNQLSESQALENIFRRTRRYAKRQLTWFKHQHKVQWLNLDDFSGPSDIVDILEKKIKT